MARRFVSLPPSAADIDRYVRTMRFDFRHLDKRRFLEVNDAEIRRLIDHINGEIAREHGSGRLPLTKHDFWALLNCEAAMEGQHHDEGERGILPLPSNVKDWNGPAAPAWDRPMPPELNLFHYALYLGEIKNKVVGHHGSWKIYPDLFLQTGIKDNIGRQAKLTAGVIHGYFYSGAYTGARPTHEELIAGYQRDVSLPDMLAGSTFKKMFALPGRQANIEDALDWVGPPAEPDVRTVTDDTKLRSAPSTDAPGTLLWKGSRISLTGPIKNGWAPVEFNSRRGFVEDRFISGDGSRAPIAMASASLVTTSSAKPELERFLQGRSGPSRTTKVTRSAEHDGEQYVVLTELDGDTGGQLLVKIGRDGTSSILAMDTVISVLPPSVPADIATALVPHPRVAREEDILAVREAVWIAQARETAPPFAGEGLNATMLHWAKAAKDNLVSTYAPPETQGGLLACAWAVNRVAELALGRQIGGGLLTSAMNEVLKRKHGPPLASPSPGTIVMSPTEDRTGHVGIVGGTLGSVVTDSTIIYSNSSYAVPKRWLDNYTIRSWREEMVEDRGLKVLLYALNPAEFGLAADPNLCVVKDDCSLRTASGSRLLRKGTKVSKTRDQDDGLSYVRVLPAGTPEGLVEKKFLDPVSSSS